ncbi:MAG TPA: hypothetical protein VMO24_02845 [Woeseiaceae bacterium]|nr:hypothetical protein [Woeseiaceae bacterium]
MKAEPAASINWRAVAKQSLGRSFWIFVLIAAASAAVCYAVLGADAFATGAERDKEWLFDLLPRVIAAQVAAGFIWVLVPRDKMTALVQRNSGGRGLLLAMFAGLIMPGGPASAFAFLAILAAAGADRGILVTYITSWALLGIQRIVVWDIPFMGMEFSLLRFVISVPLPIVAGLIARRLPYATTIENDPAKLDESR